VNREGDGCYYCFLHFLDTIWYILGNALIGDRFYQGLVSSFHNGVLDTSLSASCILLVLALAMARMVQ